MDILLNQDAKNNAIFRLQAFLRSVVRVGEEKSFIITWLPTKVLVSGTYHFLVGPRFVISIVLMSPNCALCSADNYKEEVEIL